MPPETQSIMADGITSFPVEFPPLPDQMLQTRMRWKTRGKGGDLEPGYDSN